MIIDEVRERHVMGLRRLWQEAFGDTDAFLNVFFETAFSAQRCRCVTQNDEVAAALYWFDCSCRDRKIAYLYAIATAKAHRGQGLCSSLMSDTHKHLTKQGYSGAVLVPSSESLFGFYRNMGYQNNGTVEEFCCTAAPSGTPLRRIDTWEYAERRRALLPVGGVVQEGENLTFLQTQATLYAGDGFLLAARGEGTTLYGAELLGNRAQAPAIVKSLGYTTGKFRVPGESTPFAMYRSLDHQETPPPDYFGLAFD